MLNCQKHLFSLPNDVSYINGAYMSPILKKTEQIGKQKVAQKSLPFTILTNDFFEPVVRLKQVFAKLVSIPDYRRIAVIPAVSYGIANVTKNIAIDKHQTIVMMEEQFPSNYYSWKRLAHKSGAQLKVIGTKNANRTIDWNERILEAIDERTAVVAMGTVHWADGSLFNIKAISKRAKKYGALLILDGTQSVGAMPFSIEEIQTDALICAGYKWLLGPYALSLAYYGPYFDEGIPIEESWLNRYKSEDFSGLVEYQTNYQPLAGRYSMGEHSNFILVPMLTTAIEQLLEWQPKNIQTYCHQSGQQALEQLRAMDCILEGKDNRAGHLFGVRVPKRLDLKELKANFEKEKVYVSIRGDAVRISPNVYNTVEDFDRLVHCFKKALYS